MWAWTVLNWYPISGISLGRQCIHDPRYQQSLSQRYFFSATVFYLLAHDPSYPSVVARSNSASWLGEWSVPPYAYLYQSTSTIRSPTGEPREPACERVKQGFVRVFFLLPWFDELPFRSPNPLALPPPFSSSPHHVLAEGCMHKTILFSCCQGLGSG